MSALATLLIGAGIAVGVEENGGVGPFDLELIVTITSKSIQKQSGESVFLIDALPRDCKGRDACIAAIREKTGAERVVLLRLVAAITKTVLIADRSDSPEDVPSIARIDLPPERSSWGKLIAEVASTLFPKAPEPEVTQQPAPSPAPKETARTELAPDLRPPSETPRGAYLLAGAGAASLLASVALFVSAARDIDAFETRAMDGCVQLEERCLITSIPADEAAAEVDSIRRRQGVAFAAAGAGVLLAGGGLLWALLSGEDDVALRPVASPRSGGVSLSW